MEESTRFLLDVLNEFGIKATFFIVGWVAQRHPSLIKDISRFGHEIASHGMRHLPVFRLSPQEFYKEIKESKKMLEDLSGQNVLGFRAPTYSITKKTLWALELLVEVGYRYDSSIFPIKHDLYGIPTAPRFPFLIKELNLVEFPISTYRLGKINPNFAFRLQGHGERNLGR